MNIQEEIKIFRATFKVPRWKISEDTGISESSLRYYESGTRIPSITKWNDLKNYMVNHTVAVSSAKPISGEPDQNNKENNEMNFVMKLAEEKINSQEMEIERLNSIIAEHNKIKAQPLWDNILFDVSTYQVHDDNWSQNFKIYEMNHYHDFYQRLGYTRSEAEKYWAITHRMMTNRVNMSTKEQWDFYMDGNAMPKLINVDKTDTRLSSVEQVSAHFDYAIKNNIATQLQVYNTCYYKKDGSELLAVLSVLYNFTDMSSETKIKFLDQRA
jgi:hypothetical protein